MWENFSIWLNSLPLEWMLLVSAFISATLLPGGTEALLAAAVLSTTEPSRWLLFVAMASIGNTAGAMTSWAIGRFLPQRPMPLRAQRWIERWGATALLFSWLPLVGDALPLVAGWRRIDWRVSLFFIAAGKTARFAVLALAALGVLALH